MSVGLLADPFRQSTDKRSFEMGAGDPDLLKLVTDQPLSRPALQIALPTNPLPPRTNKLFLVGIPRGGERMAASFEPGSKHWVYNPRDNNPCNKR